MGASISGAALMPRVGPRPIVPIGCVLAAVGVGLLAQIGTTTTYAGGVLLALLILGLGLGFVFGPAQNAATSGATAGEAGVASALVNTTQQIGGSIGTAVFSALFAAGTTDYLDSHAATAAQVATTAEASLFGYHIVFWAAAGVFSGGAILTAALFRSGPLPVDANAATTLSSEKPQH